MKIVSVTLIHRFIGRKLIMGRLEKRIRRLKTIECQKEIIKIDN